jgi:outer membrane protein
MKTNLVASIVVFATLLIAGSADLQAQGSAQQKFGFVDFQKILQEMPEFKQVEQKLTARRKAIQDTLAAMENDFRTRVSDYQRQRELMQPEARQTQETQLETMRQQILQYQETQSNELSKAQDEMVAPIRDKISAAVEKVAKQQGLTAVLDNSIPFYYDKKYDITFKVLDMLNSGVN